MQIPIEIGYSLVKSDNNCEKLLALKQKGVISLQDEEYIQCKGCNELVNVVEFIGKSIINCPYCDKFCGLSTSRIKKIAISEIHTKKIFEILDTQIRNAFGDLNVSFDKIERNWTIKYNGKSTLIFIYGFSTVASFLSISDNEGVILYLDERKIKHFVHDLNKSRFKYIFDEIFSSPEQFIIFIESLDFSETLEYIKFRKNFDSFISSISDTQYEKEFIPKFFEGIKQKHKELSRLYSRLQQVENTVFNSKYLKKGGPGLEDFYLVNLHRYLQDGLQCDRYGESKRYTTTQFSFNNLMNALGHAKNFSESLFFVSTNDIAPSVWNKIMDEKTSDGHFKYVIIDKDLMLMLLKNLDLLYLIE